MRAVRRLIDGQRRHNIYQAAAGDQSSCSSPPHGMDRAVEEQKSILARDASVWSCCYGS
jgi:hypothetical protein